MRKLGGPAAWHKLEGFTDEIFKDFGLYFFTLFVGEFGDAILVNCVHELISSLCVNSPWGQLEVPIQSYFLKYLLTPRLLMKPEDRVWGQHHSYFLSFCVVQIHLEETCVTSIQGFRVDVADLHDLYLRRLEWFLY